MTEYERLVELKKEMQEKRKKRICMFSCLGAAVIAMGAVTFLVVTDGFPSDVDEVADEETATESVITEESALLAVSMNNASEDEYFVAVQYYINQGDDIGARDLLEDCYAAYGSQDALEMLDDIYIDVADDSQAIQYMASELETNARTEGYFAEVLHLFQDELWAYTMAPVSAATVRNYYLVLADDSQIYFTVTKDADGAVASQLWQEIDGNFQYVSFDDGTAQVIDIAMENAEIALSSDLISQLKAGDNSFYNGAYTCYTLDAATGGVTLVTATANAGELNDLVEKNHEGTASADVYDLWNSRVNYSYTTVKDEREAAESTAAASANTTNSGTKKKTTSSTSASSSKTSSATSNSTSESSTGTSSTSSTSSSTNTSAGSATTSGNTGSGTASTGSTTSAATSGGSSAGSTAGQASAGASSAGGTSAGTSSGTGSATTDAGSGSSGSAVSDGSSSGSASSATSADAGASSGGSAAPSTSAGTDTDAGWTSDLL